MRLSKVKGLKRENEGSTRCQGVTFTMYMDRQTEGEK